MTRAELILHVRAATRVVEIALRSRAKGVRFRFVLALTDESGEWMAVHGNVSEDDAQAIIRAAAAQEDRVDSEEALVTAIRVNGQDVPLLEKRGGG